MDQARKQQLANLIMASLVGIALVVAFAVSPPQGGDDWERFKVASQQVWTRALLHGDRTTHAGYHNPAWLGLDLAPLGILHFGRGWALLSVTTLAIVSAVVRRSEGGFFKAIVVLLSPSDIYILRHGQVDGLVLGDMLLSQGWCILVGLTKPQVTIGLVFGIPRTRLLRAITLIAVCPLISCVRFHTGPPGLIRQPNAPARSVQSVGWTLALPSSSRRHRSSVSMIGN